MILRPESRNGDPHPTYSENDSYVTLAIYHGGDFVHEPEAKYVGGRISYFDYLNVNIVTIDILHKLCEEIGYMGQNKYYRIDRKKFRLVLYQTEFFSICFGLAGSNKFIVLYLDAEKDVVQSHAVVTRRNIKITKNDNRRMYARCLGDNCDWKVNALKVGNECTFQIREYVSQYKCGSTFHVKNVKSGWLSQKYEDSFRTDPNRSVKGFRNDVIKDIRVSVSKHQAYRAKRRALRKIEGDENEQFAKLWDYALELRRINPGTTVIMVMTGDDEARKFDKFYVCFQALKEGFQAGCRPIIGVDGCHLKGPHGGVLLTAVSIDPNNSLFPIAYVVACSETRDSW